MSNKESEPVTYKNNGVKPPEIIKQNQKEYRLASMQINPEDAEEQQNILEEQTGYHTMAKQYGRYHCVYLEEYKYPQRRFA